MGDENDSPTAVAKCANDRVCEESLPNVCIDCMWSTSYGLSMEFMTDDTNRQRAGRRR